MKLNIERDTLYEALQKVQSAVEKKNTIQILSNILCIVQNNKLSLCTTDLEVGIKITVSAEVQQEGKITLSAKHFVDIVKELPSTSLSISKKDNDWIEITCGKSHFNIVSLPSEDYPSLPNFEKRDYYEANSESILNMINKTSFAVSTDATRYHLNGVFFEILEDNVMRMVATDGHRLSFVDQEIFKNKTDLKRGIIIPKKGLAELKKLLEQNNKNIRISFEKGYLFANSEETYLFIRLIEGEYPDYRQVIPKESAHKIKLNREKFTSSLKRVVPLAHEKSNGIKIIFNNNSLHLSSSNPDMGDAHDELEIEFSGEPVDIGFNAKYLLDFLPCVQSDEIEFGFTDKLSPGILRGVGHPNHTYVIMPMRI